MKLTAEKLKTQWEKDPARMALQLAEVLQDFGYLVDVNYVKEALTKIYKGESVSGGPAMFLQGWVKDGME